MSFAPPPLFEQIHISFSVVYFWLDFFANLLHQIKSLTHLDAGGLNNYEFVSEAFSQIQKTLHDFCVHFYSHVPVSILIMIESSHCNDATHINPLVTCAAELNLVIIGQIQSSYGLFARSQGHCCSRRGFPLSQAPGRLGSIEDIVNGNVAREETSLIALNCTHSIRNIIIANVPFLCLPSFLLKLSLKHTTLYPFEHLYKTYTETCTPHLSINHTIDLYVQ